MCNLNGEKQKNSLLAKKKSLLGSATVVNLTKLDRTIYNEQNQFCFFQWPSLTKKPYLYIYGETIWVGLAPEEQITKVK